MQNFRRFIGYTALSVSLASPAPAQTATTASPGWWSKPGFLPAQATLSIRPVDVRVQGFSGVARSERYCEVNGTPLAPRTGLIPDTGNFYIVSLDRSGKQCELTPLVSIKPANPAIAQELLDSIDARVPGGAKFIKGQVKTGMEQFKVDAAPKHMPGVGVVVPAESPSALALLFALSTGNTGTRPQVAAPAPTGTPLTGEWWNKPNLLPTSPQGTISAGGRDATGNCRINQHGLQLVAVPEGSIVLTDTTRAFAVLANCRVEPLITLPARSNTTQPAISVAGGGLRNPGQIKTQQNPAIERAALPLLVLAAEETALYVWGALGALGVGSMTAWNLQGKTVIAAGSVSVQAMNNRNIAGMSADEYGSLYMQSLSNRTAVPTKEQVEDGIKRTAPADASLEGTFNSESGGSGKCSPEEKNFLQKNVDSVCKPEVTCRPFTDSATATVFAKINHSCANAREEINNRCYDGGDKGHREAARSAWIRAGKCLERIVP